MYLILLILHSLLRWFLLISLIYTIYRSFDGWLKNKTFSKMDETLRSTTTTLTHIQLIIGILLYIISPLIAAFFRNFKDLVHNREIRFFGIEHNIMMLAAIIIITIGSIIAKRKSLDQDKFKTIAIWFTIGLIIILISIPWSFSPLAGRPLFRFY